MKKHHYRVSSVLLFLVLIALIQNMEAYGMGGNTHEVDSLWQVVNTEESEAKIDALNQLSWNFRKTNGDTAMYFAQQALVENEGTNYLKGKVISYNTLGTIYYYQSDFHQAIAYFKKAFESSVKLNDSDRMAKTSNNVGTLNKVLGNYDESLKYHLISLRMKEERKDTIGMINSIRNIAGLYYQINKYPEGVGICRKAIKMAQETQSPKVASLYGTLGTLYNELGQYDSALLYQHKSLTLNLKSSNRKQMSVNYQNIAGIYFYLNNFNEAQKYYQKSYDIKQEQHDEQGLGKANMGLGQTYYHLGQPQKSIGYLVEAKNYFLEVNQPFELVSIYEYLAKTMNQIAVYDSAYNYLLKSYNLSDSLYTMESKVVIEEMEEKYETEKRELQLQNQAVIIEKNEATIKNYAVLALLLGFGIGISSWLYYRKQKALKKLMEKNLEIAQRSEKPKDNIATDRQKIIYERMLEVLEQKQMYVDVNLTIDKLAKTINTNRTELSESIQVFTKNNYPALINQYRINHAIKLISDSKINYSIEAISKESGYHSTSNFYRVFKEITGLTPAAFSKRNKAS